MVADTFVNRDDMLIGGLVIPLACNRNGVCVPFPEPGAPIICVIFCLELSNTLDDMLCKN